MVSYTYLWISPLIKIVSRWLYVEKRTQKNFYEFQMGIELTTFHTNQKTLVMSRSFVGLHNDRISQSITLYQERMKIILLIIYHN